MPGGLTLLVSANADIPTPAAGKVTVFFSLEEGGPAYKDDAGSVFPLEGPTGSAGPSGPPGFAFDGEPGESFPIALPGPVGATGATGSTGAQGPMGPALTMMEEPNYENANTPMQSQGAAASSGSGSATQLILPRRFYTFGANGTNVTFLIPANTTPTTAGTGTAPAAESYTFTRFTSSAGAASAAGIRIGGSAAGVGITFGRSLPKFQCLARTGATLTDIRFFIGLRLPAATPGGDTENNMALFRYSTNVPDAGWVGITIDNVGNLNSTGNMMNIAANNWYLFTVEYLTIASVKFTIQDLTGALGTVTATISTANLSLDVALGVHATATTIVSGARVLDLSAITLESN